MLSSSSTATGFKPVGGEHLDASLRELLDHVAVELAHEYIRLMETAAQGERTAESTDQEENR
jgi:hypothetical protein